MDPFSVGDGVIVRYGQWQGSQGVVVARQRADVYAVRLADGELLFFGRASLLAVARPSRLPEAAPWGAPSRN